MEKLCIVFIDKEATIKVGCIYSFRKKVRKRFYILN